MAIGDLFTKVTDGTGNPAVTTVVSGRSPGGASLSCDDLENWPQDTVHFITYQKTASGLIDKTTQQDFKGIVSGDTIGTVTLQHSPTGSDLGNSIGDFVQLAPTASYAQDLFDGLDEIHNPDGTLKANTVDSDQYVDGSIDTVHLANSAVETAKLADASVTSAKVDFGGAGAGIWWEEIGRTTLGSAGDTLSVTFAARKYLSISIFTINSGQNDLSLVFNSDTAGNYAYDVTTGANSLGLDTGTPSEPQYFTMELINPSTAQAKFGWYKAVRQGSGATGASVPVERNSFFKWGNTADQITTITITNNGTGDLATGSEIVVRGHD